MFEKTKKFVNEHKTEIYAVAAGAAIVVAACAGYQYAMKSVTKDISGNGAMQIIHHVLNDIPEGTKIRAYGGIHCAGLTAKDLGKLGESMLAQGADEIKDAFTHFIAIEKI